VLENLPGEGDGVFVGLKGLRGGDGSPQFGGLFGKLFTHRNLPWQHLVLSEFCHELPIDFCLVFIILG
jgi:hypothetical protein